MKTGGKKIREGFLAGGSSMSQKDRPAVEGKERESIKEENAERPKGECEGGGKRIPKKL